MSEAVLDTSAVIAFFRGHPRLKAVMAASTRLVVPAIALGELYLGRLGPGRWIGDDHGIRALLESPRVEVAQVGEPTAERYAVIVGGLRRAGRPIPSNDVWVAATAMERGLRVLTLDRHFLEIPQILVEVFEP